MQNDIRKSWNNTLGSPVCEINGKLGKIHMHKMKFHPQRIWYLLYFVQRKTWDERIYFQKVLVSGVAE